MLLGCHVGISGGLENVPATAKALGCDVFQIFTKNQMQWKHSPLKPESVEGYKAGVKEHGMGPALVHCSYLLNCASPDDALWEKSVNGLVVEIERADALGIPYITFHPGSPKDKGEEWGCKRVGEAISVALSRTKGTKPMVLVETNAGQGKQVGDTFLELAQILDAVSEKKRVGVCFDTCHVFVSGYDIASEEGYEDTFATFDNEVGLARLKAFHLNDSKEGLNSRKDRHEKIGEGKLGAEFFKRLINDPRFKDLPGYLETPVEETEEYAGEIKSLRKLQKKK
ncbi:MAG TPA: deoxyribonuclease IV [Candidatus Thermoplasmatota archaeon]|nr:deoxyribonuclease IV [Candidatus Thermoplasmatota archaeon]